MRPKGVVYLVGAGPGDAGLLTLRGAELLGRAEVVVYDSLVHRDLLRFAPPQAEMICRRSKEQAIPQDEVNELLVSRARAGKCVVRLKGGDPYTFGRGGEEAEQLAAAGVQFEVVPGISSTVAAPNYAGIPLTHRALSSSYTVITGHEDPDKDEGNVDWTAIARIPGTKVILMGVERIRPIAETLVRNGMAAETPVAMVRWGTTGQQRSIQGTLATIADVVTETGFTAPAVAVIGEVVKLRAKLNWFENRPLFRQRIVVTRTRDQAAQLAGPLIERGAEVLEIPTIKIVPPSDLTDLKDAILALHEYDWVVFTSPNGVSAFFEFFFKGFDDVRDIGGMKIAAVGPATAAKIKELHLQVTLMPEDYVASKVADAFRKLESIENLRVLLARAEVANPELPRALEKLGAIVDDVACYRTVPETDDAFGDAARLREEGADWITFTSGSTVEQFHARFDLPALRARFPRIHLASIGPETSKALQALHIEPTVESRVHTIPGLVEALTRHVSSKR